MNDENGTGRCTTCHYPLHDLPFVGDGDGSGQRFAHLSCFRERALKKEYDDAFRMLGTIIFSQGRIVLTQKDFESVPRYFEIVRVDKHGSISFVLDTNSFKG